MKWFLISLASAGVVVQDQDAYDLTILHTNDVHSHYDQANKRGNDCSVEEKQTNKCYGGLARLKTAIDAKRAEHPKSLLLDAGDHFQGTQFYTYYKGNVTAEAMNLLGYDLMTLGNHEFDHGPAILEGVASMFKFPVVSSNVDASAYPGLNSIVKPYHLFPRYNLAVVGYLTYEAPAISKVEDVVVEKPEIAMKRIVAQVQALGYKRIIAVSHNGYEEDIELAKQVNGLALIVGGHTNTFLAPGETAIKIESSGPYPTPVETPDKNTTYVVQAYCWGRILGHLDISFNENGYLSKFRGNPIELDSSVEMNAEVDARVQELREPFDEFNRQVIGHTLTTLEQSNCQTGECVLGSFVADAVLDNRPEADFAIINAGSMRGSIDQGDITVGNVRTVFPYGNSIVQIKVSGSYLWSFLEGVVSKKNIVSSNTITSLVQVSGLRFTYDDSRPVHSKLLRVEIKDKASGTYQDLVHNKEYLMATLDFLVVGGDYIISPPMKNVPTLETTEDVLISYIKAKTPLNPALGGRIIKVQSISSAQE